MERLKQRFADDGVAPRDLPLAFAVHEVLGLGMALGWWGLCYQVRPSAGPLAAATRAAATALPAAAAAYQAALTRASARVAAAPWLPGDPGRLTVSLAESIVVRAALKPATFVFKLWATYQVVAAVARRRTAPVKAQRRRALKK